MPRMLGDLYPATNPDNILDVHDVDEYAKAIQLNTTHSMWENVEDPSNPSRRINELIDPENGGLIYDQFIVADLHDTGFISNIDKMLLQSYITSGTTEVSLKGYIDSLDSKEVIPPPDPTDTKTLAELREYIVTTVQTLVIFQAQKFWNYKKPHHRVYMIFNKRWHVCGQMHMHMIMILPRRLMQIWELDWRLTDLHIQRMMDIVYYLKICTIVL